MEWHTYILRCEDGSFYVGHTCNVEKRFERHKTKAGARFTAAHVPETVEHVETYSSEQEAVHRERQLKKWSRAKKEALIRGSFEELKALSKCRHTIA